MRMRIWLWAVAAVVVASPSLAAPFGTRSWAQLGGAQTSDTRIEPLPATAASWLADGESYADAVAAFGSLQAAVGSAPGSQGWAAALWSDTFVVTSDVGASGSAPIALHLRLDGSVDAGAGGFAQLTLHALVGTDVDNDADALAPNVVAAAAERRVRAACDAGECDPAIDAGGALDLDATFEYGAPFRFTVLLEALAADGGVADAGPSGWLSRIDLPEGAVLHAASGGSFAADASPIPEPGTLLLVALGLAALPARRAP